MVDLLSFAVRKPSIWPCDAELSSKELDKTAYMLENQVLVEKPKSPLWGWGAGGSQNPHFGAGGWGGGGALSSIDFASRKKASRLS